MASLAGPELIALAQLAFVCGPASSNSNWSGPLTKTGGSLAWPRLGLADVPGVAHAEQITMERKILGALTVIWPWLDAVFSLGLLLLADLVH